MSEKFARQLIINLNLEIKILVRQRKQAEANALNILKNTIIKTMKELGHEL